MDERNHQVALMGEIYSSAKSVVVWLGDGDNDTLSSLVALMAIVEGFKARERHLIAQGGGFLEFMSAEDRNLLEERVKAFCERRLSLSYIPLSTSFNSPLT